MRTPPAQLLADVPAVASLCPSAHAQHRYCLRVGSAGTAGFAGAAGRECRRRRSAPATPVRSPPGRQLRAPPRCRPVGFAPALVAGPGPPGLPAPPLGPAPGPVAPADTGQVWRGAGAFCGTVRLCLNRPVVAGSGKGARAAPAVVGGLGAETPASSPGEAAARSESARSGAAPFGVGPVARLLPYREACAEAAKRTGQHLRGLARSLPCDSRLGLQTHA